MKKIDIVGQIKKIDIKESQRLIELDLWRGTAVFCMIIFHILVVYNLFGITDFNLNSYGYLTLARYIQISFLLLVGISLTISRIHARDSKSYYKKQLLRGLVVALCALIVTSATKVYIPEKYVFFGILHLISFSIFVFMFAANRRYLSIILGIWILLMGLIINVTPMGNSLIWIILGFNVHGYSTLDHFSIFPWASIVCFGIFLGTFFNNYIKIRPKFKFLEKSRIVNFFVILGKNALVIYMIHMPIIVGFVMLYKIMFQ